ncbi:MAG: hypothetical protein Q4F72_09005 [Desulfovibrionaceae bacterium]|nr:hypothetical protein [Desulfovibrionaceae bacterium]
MSASLKAIPEPELERQARGKLPCSQAFSRPLMGTMPARRACTPV